MIRFAVNQWDKNKHKLEKDIRENFSYYNSTDYKGLVVKMVDLILNDEDSEYEREFDSKSITEIDNGNYQGTLLYVIPQETYQPSEDSYLMTHVSYGSCSGCDTLQSIHGDYYYDEDEDEEPIAIREETIKEYVQLILNLVQNITKPYNNGWNSDEDFNHIEENDKAEEYVF